MQRQEIKKIILCIFMFGFFGGIVYGNLFSKAYMMSTGIFSDYFLSNYSGRELNVKEYILYIARLRITPLIILAVLACMNRKKIMGGLCLLWTGFSVGIMLTAAVLKMGMLGIVLCVVGIMPHFICYITVYVMILLYLFMYPEVRWNSSKTISSVIFLMMGMITECYINPVLMDIFISTIL